jgi:hypothetical protein
LKLEPSHTRHFFSWFVFLSTQTSKNRQKL